MKFAGCRFFIACLVIVVFLAGPVCANPIEMSYTKFIITQNNSSFNDSFDFSMNCYGYKMPRGSYINSAPTYGVVFSTPVSCLPGDCGYWNEYRRAGSLGINSCNIVGSYQGQSFTIENFTTDPESRCFSIENDFENKTSYAVPVKESEECWNQYTLAEDACATKYDRNNDSTKHNYYSCDRKLYSEQKNCAQDHGNLINDPEILKYSPIWYCELRFDIGNGNSSLNIPSPSDTLVGYAGTAQPSSNFTSIGEDTPSPPALHYTPRSPIESLYCGILSIFGAKC
jgi:hypothetical protein